MRVRIVARLGGNRRSGLELDRAYRVYAGPDEGDGVLVFDDNDTSFRWVTPGEYREVPDPLDRHDLVRIDQVPGGFTPVCLCVWRWRHADPDPDEAARSHQAHQWHMQVNRWLLEAPADPQLLAWIEQQRAHRRQEPER
jgi:hypothetical protein